MTKESVPALQSAAQAGDAEAQYTMASLYVLGLYVPTDYKQVAAWLEKAALQGHVYALAELGAFYAGLFVKHDIEKANELFAQALPRLQKMADQGDVYAQYALADMYCLGEGVAQDKKKAMQLMLKALPGLKALADKGDFEAQCTLATLMLSELSIPDVEAISLPYLKKLVDQGSSAAKATLAAYLLNKGQLEEAIALTRQALSNNCPLAAMMLISYHYQKLIKASDEELLSWLALMENQYMIATVFFPDDEYSRLQKLKQAAPSE